MAVPLLDRVLYTTPVAARALGVPDATLWWWLDGRDDGKRRYEPVIRLEPTGVTEVTWGEFVEAWYVREYRRRGVPLQQLRPVIKRLRTELGLAYPLAHARPFVAAGKRLVHEIEDELRTAVSVRMIAIASGQLMLTPPAESFLEKVEFSEAGADGWVARVRPLGKRQPVVIDPEVGFGAPTVRGIRTGAVVELVRAGEPLAVVAADFGLREADLESAVAFERLVASSEAA